MIHQTAIVHRNAEIANDVEIGAYTIIGDGVKIGQGCRIESHVVVKGSTQIGKDNHIFQFCSIGDDPQDKKFHGEKESGLIIGDGNTIREYVSISRGSLAGAKKTIIGDNNWIMAYVHIAHDCAVGNETILSNNVCLAGHVSVGDMSVLSGFTIVRQFCRVGCLSFTSGATALIKDLPPFVIADSGFGKPRGLNKEGMKRNGYTSEQINQLKEAYRLVYRNGLLMKDSLKKIKQLADTSREVAIFYEFINTSERGIVR